jgi:hypothetical protein
MPRVAPVARARSVVEATSASKDSNARWTVYGRERKDMKMNDGPFRQSYPAFAKLCRPEDARTNLGTCLGTI